MKDDASECVYIFYMLLYIPCRIGTKGDSATNL